MTRRRVSSEEAAYLRDEWPKRCTGPCGRWTMPRKRERERLHMELPDNWNGAIAARSDGMCSRCHALAFGRKQHKGHGGYNVDSRGRYLPTGRAKREPFDVAKCRADLEAMWQDRRRRGIPEWGIDPADLRTDNALYSWEVP